MNDIRDSNQQPHTFVGVRNPARHAPTIVLSDREISEILTMKKTIELVEAAFVAHAYGYATPFPAVVESIVPFGVHFGVKSGVIASSSLNRNESPQMALLQKSVGDVIGLKAGGYWMHNLERHGLPGHRATLILFDPETGNSTALMSANTITRLRTAAAGAIATRYLANPDATIVGVVGSGEQAHAQIEALLEEREISKLQVWSRRYEAASEYAEIWQTRGLRTNAVLDIRDLARTTEILITTTPAHEPLIHNEWVEPGSHISAIGSDGAGKQEIDSDLLGRAKVVVDIRKQSLSIGELQQSKFPHRSAAELIYAELGEVCAGMKQGRTNFEEITVFDSSGISFQDLVVAGYLARLAEREHLGARVVL
jgi:alanine dehydrogenase